MSLETSIIPDSNFGFRLIEEILNLLNRNDIKYCVMRNSDEIIGKFPKGDVDILVSKGWRTQRKLNNLLFRSQDYLGCTIYAECSHANISKNFYISTTVEGNHYTINLEFFNEIFVHECRKFKAKKYNYFNVENILETRITNSSVYSCSEYYEILFKLVDSLFNDKPKNFAWLDKNLKKVYKVEAFQELAKETIGSLAVKELENFNWRTENVSSCAQLQQLIFNYFQKNSVYPLFSDISRDIWSLARHAKQYVRPGGKFCVVMGTDGSGKTTVCDEFRRKHERAFNKVHRIHLGNRPILLPSLRGTKIIGSRNQLSDNSIKNFHDYELTTKSFSFYQTARFIYITVDYILHYWFVLRLLVSRGDLILTERYITDYIIVPERYFPSVPIWIKKLCVRLVPKPNLAIHLRSDLNDIMSRKQELPRNLIVLELTRFETYSRAQCMRVIENSGELSTAVDMLGKMIFIK